MNWDIRTDICTTLCTIGNQWEAAVQREPLSSMLYDDPEGSDGVGVGGRVKRQGIYVYFQLIHVVLTQHCNVIIPQFYKAL